MFTSIVVISVQVVLILAAEDLDTSERRSCFFYAITQGIKRLQWSEFLAVFFFWSLIECNIKQALTCAGSIVHGSIFGLFSNSLYISRCPLSYYRPILTWTPRIILIFPFVALFSSADRLSLTMRAHLAKGTIYKCVAYDTSLSADQSHHTILLRKLSTKGTKDQPWPVLFYTGTYYCQHVVVQFGPQLLGWNVLNLHQRSSHRICGDNETSHQTLLATYQFIFLWWLCQYELTSRCTWGLPMRTYVHKICRFPGL